MGSFCKAAVDGRDAGSDFGERLFEEGGSDKAREAATDRGFRVSWTGLTPIRAFTSSGR